MRILNKYDIGIVAFPKEKNMFNFITPKSVVKDDRHPIFEKGYWWLFFYFYKRRSCTRCGVISCKKGLIPLYSDIETKEKVVGWFCPSCGKTVKEIQQRSRKRCNRCESLHTNCDGGRGCTKYNVNE